MGITIFKSGSISDHHGDELLQSRAVLNRLTGVECPIAGEDWTPPEDHRADAKRLLMFLKGRRALNFKDTVERGSYLVQSVMRIRKHLVTDFGDVPKDSVLGESIQAMRAACRSFTKEMGSGGTKRYHVSPSLLYCLGELRAAFGAHITRLTYAYDLPMDEELAALVPEA